VPASAEMAGLLLDGVQELPAGLFAAPAGLGADPAVLVHPGMPLAFVAAAPADGHAGLQQRPGDLGVTARRAWMVVLTAVVFAEKIWRSGQAFGYAAGALMMIAALLLPWLPPVQTALLG
jgi:hypothetical protein